MKNKISIALLMTVLPMTAMAAPVDKNGSVLEQFSDNELHSTNGLCFVSNAAHKVIIASKGADQVKINGKIISLVRKDNSPANILEWTSDHLDIVFTAPKGKSLESNPGTFSSGTLKVVYKGVASSMRATDQCDGDGEPDA
jgi:hypothetical protein